MDKACEFTENDQEKHKKLDKSIRIKENATEIMRYFLVIFTSENKERYIHLNAEFQRTARRDKKAFLSDKYKEIEGKKQNGKD